VDFEIFCYSVKSSYKLITGEALSFRFAYPVVLWIGIPFLLCFSYFFLRLKRRIAYSFPLISHVINAGFVSGNFKKITLNFLRITVLTALLCLAARPQWVDIRSSLNLDNVDIFVALDTSGSMSLIDDLKDTRTRMAVAKHEAINFIKKRSNDRIGFGVFATDALTLAPITDDKNFLQQIVDDTNIGVVAEQSTSIGKGLAMGVARLRDSTAKSKVIIFLTDGDATNQDDFPIDRALELAVDKNIKIYTVGIGSQRPYAVDQFGRLHNITGSYLNETLLKKIATITNGHYFPARNPLEIQRAYDEIDKLEKTKQQAQLFTKYDECFWLLFFIASGALFSELLLSVFVWKYFL